jgi:hypothetical protein
MNLAAVAGRERPARDTEARHEGPVHIRCSARRDGGPASRIGIARSGQGRWRWRWRRDGDGARGSCAQIVSAIVDPNPLPINPNPVFPEPIVVQTGAPVGPAVAFDVTVNNQCVDEVAAGPKGSVAVATTTFDTATGARLFTGVNMQPAFARMTWRSWLSIPTADTTVRAITQVISVTKANGQVQDTLTYTAAALNQATLTAVATGLPQSLR